MTTKHPTIAGTLANGTVAKKASSIKPQRASREADIDGRTCFYKQPLKNLLLDIIKIVAPILVRLAWSHIYRWIE